MTDAKPRGAPPPPVAAKHPEPRQAHGVAWVDDYAWIRADNWREVLRDPATLPADIRALLEAENAYADAMLAPTRRLQRELVREMRARLKEDDSDVPQTDGPYAYYSRFRHGGQHRIVCRRPRGGGKEAVLVDGDARAAGQAFFHLTFARHSPDHGKLAWSADDKGSEMSTIRVRDVAGDADLDDAVDNATGDAVWTADSQAFLYVEQDEAHRPWRVMRHRLGTPQRDDAEIFEEVDPAWFIAIRPTRLGRVAMISVHGHDSSETYVVDLADPAAKPRLIAPRRPGFRYEAMDHGDVFYIRANSGGAADFQILTAPRDAPHEANWRPFVPHRPGRLIEHATLFRDFLVLLAREDNVPHLIVHPLDGGAPHEIAFEAPIYTLGLEPVYEFDSPTFRFSFASMACSQEIYDYDVAHRQRILRKKQETPTDFDASAYVTRCVFAEADDGERVPISLIHRRDIKLDGTAPLLLYGYGAYGHAMDAGFSTNRLSLVDRGFVCAIAHVRGGAEKGWGWYEAGKLAAKPNTFTDFIAGVRTSSPPATAPPAASSPTAAAPAAC